MRVHVCVHVHVCLPKLTKRDGIYLLSQCGKRPIYVCLLLIFLLRDAVKANMFKIRAQSRRADRDRQCNFHSSSQKPAPRGFAWPGSQLGGEDLCNIFSVHFRGLLTFE